MGGICGFIGSGEPKDLAEMSAAMAYRGLNSPGEWSDPSRRVFLASRRLATLDLPHSAQPMATLDGDLIVVFNGEIYNHAELRKELESLGCKFFTDHSDTEVILNGFRYWRKQLPTKLIGMWSFAIYDVERRMLFASRDRFGEKPFHYTTIHGGFG